MLLRYWQGNFGGNHLKSRESLTRSYVLVTPVKNESDNLPRLIKSIMSQTVKPALWVLVDDESTDGTELLLRRLQSECEFVRVISSEEGKRSDSIDKYGVIVRKGMDFAIQQCKSTHLNYDYIALVDADLWLEKSYFEKIILGLEGNSKVGLASGAIWEKIGHDLILRQSSQGKPDFTAAGMVMRRECYESVGGYPKTAGPEFVLAIKARSKKWEMKCFPDAVGIHMRRSGQKIGQWKGFSKCGEIHYKINYHPVDALLLGIYFTFCKPYALNGPTISGLAFFSGYVQSFIFRKEKLADPDVIYYFYENWRLSVKNIFYSLLGSTRRFCHCL